MIEDKKTVDPPAAGRRVDALVGLPVVVHINWKTASTTKGMIEDDLFKTMILPMLPPIGCEFWIEPRPEDCHDMYVVESVEYWENGGFHVQCKTVEIDTDRVKLFLSEMRNGGWEYSGGFKQLD